MSWYDDWQMEDGTPVIAVIALWLFVLALFVFGLCISGWIFRMSWLNTMYFTGLALSALSIICSLVQRLISRGRKRSEDD